MGLVCELLQDFQQSMRIEFTCHQLCLGESRLLRGHCIHMQEPILAYYSGIGYNMENLIIQKYLKITQCLLLLLLHRM